jgi:hypothetical protein
MKNKKFLTEIYLKKYMTEYIRGNNKIYPNWYDIPKLPAALVFE